MDFVLTLFFLSLICGSTQVSGQMSEHLSNITYYLENLKFLLGKRGGLFVSVLTPDRVVWVWDVARFMGKTLNSHSASIHPGV